MPFTVEKTFPLLIELRDFKATRRTNDNVDSFLDYALYLGRTEQYIFDDQWRDATLKAAPSLALFDGLDEIFNRAEREKVMHEIAGFAQRYPLARIVQCSVQLHQRARVTGISKKTVDDVLTAASELGTRWPGDLRIPETMKWAEDLTFGQLNLPKFVAAALGDRAIVRNWASNELWTLRQGALQALVAKWPNESTRELLRARAVEDQHPVVRGAACKALGEMHSRFGRVVITKDLDGRGPYLDPLRPIPREHFEKAATKAGIAVADLEAQIASLNQHLGWDIRVGARP